MSDKIAKQLGVTAAGLRLLARAASQPDGRASGPGFGFSAAGARARLTNAGLVEDTGEKYPFQSRITSRGRELVAQARILGW